jgi:hypothetical protein
MPPSMLEAPGNPVCPPPLTAVLSVQASCRVLVGLTKGTLGEAGEQHDRGYFEWPCRLENAVRVD